MRHAHFDSPQAAGTPIGRRKNTFAAWPLAVMLVALAGCGSDDPSGPVVDTVAPTVSATNPINGAVGVAVITASFSEAMDASTITAANFGVSETGGAAVTGTVSYNATTHIATFTPTTGLDLDTDYTATVTTGAKDVAGNALASNKVWSFTTAATSATQLAPDLGDAGAYVVLAGTTVTSTGLTTLTDGDLGVNPGTSITGFTGIAPGGPGTVTGGSILTGAAAVDGQTALALAYDDLVARTDAPVTVAGNLGGLTLPPGLYKSTSSLAISSGDLTLDAGGDADAVFIFQVASTLTTTAGRAVILAGNAQAANVFWQVGSSATLGTTSNFKGNILALTSITMNTGATLTGRALCQTGAVSLSANAVTMASTVVLSSSRARE